MPLYVFLSLLPGTSTVQVVMSLRTAFMGANVRIPSVSLCPDTQPLCAHGFQGDFSTHTLSSGQCSVTFPAPDL